MTMAMSSVDPAGAVGTLLQDLWQPWSEPLMQRALLESALVGIVGGALGCWIVLYGLAYGAESLAHSIFPGLVLAALIGAPLLAGGAAGLIVAAILIALAARAPTIGGDTAIAVVVTSLFGLGALMALSAASPPGIQSLLFGDLFGVTTGELALAGALGGLVLVALRLLHGQLLVVGFDRRNAVALGGKPLAAELALLILLALEILIAVQGMGNLLVVSILIGPAATARLLARRMEPMMLLAAAFAIVASAGGLYVSYYAGTAGGASIASAIVALYLLVFAGRQISGDRR